MFFRILLLVVFLQMVCVDACPDSAQIWPCQCYKKNSHVDITCIDTQLVRVLKVKANLGKALRGVELTLERVQMPNLPSKLLTNLDLKVLKILQCHLSSIDKNALSDVANSLEWLDLSHNSFKEVPSAAFQKLYWLKSLYIEHNQLEVLPAHSFKGLHSLFVLSLKWNRIQVVDGLAFAGIESNLEILFLNWNELTAVPSESLRNISSLDVLGLKGNKIDALQTEKLSSGSLTFIDLGDNQIRQIPRRAFVFLKKVENVDLSRNAIEYIHSSAFEGNGNTLKEVQLSHNRLHKVPTASLRNLTRLKYLILNNNNITKVRKDDFVWRSNTLYSLHLEKNSLSHVDPMAFVPLVSLYFLHLESNQLSTAPYETYAPILGTLSRFDIQGNPLNCDCDLLWLRDFMHENASLFPRANEVKCVCPEEHGAAPLAQIPRHRLICRRDSTPQPAKKCDSRTLTESDSSHSSCDALLVSLLTSLACFFIALLRGRLF